MVSNSDIKNNPETRQPISPTTSKKTLFIGLIIILGIIFTIFRLINHKDPNQPFKEQLQESRNKFLELNEQRKHELEKNKQRKLEYERQKMAEEVEKQFKKDKYIEELKQGMKKMKKKTKTN